MLVGVVAACALAACGGSGDGPEAPASRVLAFDVTVPEGTPGAVLVTGNVAALGAWTPASGFALTDAGGGRWTGSVVLPHDVTLVEYKYTRGAWTTVEKGSGCAEVANRQATLTAATTIATDAVLTWADWCP